METARDVYAVTDIALDPFSPGLQPFTRVPAGDLPGLRARTVKQLAALERGDAPVGGLLCGAAAVFEALAVTTSGGTDGGASADRGRRSPQAAAEALRTGDMRRVEQLADDADGGGPAPEPVPTPGAPAALTTPESRQPAKDLLVTFSPDTLAAGAAARARAPAPGITRRASLAPPVRLESPLLGPGRTLRTDRRPPGAPASRHPRGLPRTAGDADDPSARELRWRPALADTRRRGRPGGGLPRCRGRRPAGGVRPPGRAAAPEPPRAPPHRDRAGVAEHGARVVDKEIGLDPRAFRLVCIPPDVHLRLGEAEGWGASLSGPTSTATSSWPTGDCGRSPGATRGSAGSTTSWASAGTTTRTGWSRGSRWCAASAWWPGERAEDEREKGA